MLTIYHNHILPWLIERVMSAKDLIPLRREVLEVTRGTVVEIGFGAGANLPFYPDGVTRLVAVDSHPAILRRARQDGRPGLSLEIQVAEAAAIRAPSATADFVVSTFTLCSVDDPAQVLREVRRILKSCGRFVFLEHGLGDHAAIQRWQRRLTPLSRKLAGGCCLDRDIEQLIAAAGFRFERLKKFRLEQIPATHGYLYAGVAAPGPAEP